MFFIDLPHTCTHVRRYLEPEKAAAKGEEHRKKIAEAKLVHVISTRFRTDRSQADVKDACDPFKTAAECKEALEKSDGVFTFDPNYDNAFLMGGDSDSANAIWLRNWRMALTRAQETGGRCVQVIVKPGLSEMQHAEADMAADKNVPVVKLDCTNCKFSADVVDFKKMEGWKELMDLVPK